MTTRLTVRAGVAPLLGEPRISQPLTSQLTAGTILTVLERRGDWVHVRGEDDYTGWTHVGYLMPCSGSEHTWRISLGCTARDSTGHGYALPLGARVSPHADIVAGEALDAAERAGQFPPEPETIVRTAITRFSGTSYLWGGVTPWGCDCSGLVQRAFALHGIALPRDAWQQATAGEPLPGDASELAASVLPAASLLFFTDRDDRRVTHVGIATGDGGMVHSALARGGVAVERMDSEDAYVTRLRAGCTGVIRP